MTDFKVKDIIREKPGVDCVIAEKYFWKSLRAQRAFTVEPEMP